MPRTDLLSLSPDDLATLSNRGLVKRALVELDAGQLSYTLSENAAGTVSVLWSDDVHCLLPSGASLQNGKCSCSATGLCRHLIRSVLAYGRQHRATEMAESQDDLVALETTAEEASAAPASSWNPGEFSVEELAKEMPPAVLARARKMWEGGHVIEVTLAARPTALFHTLGVNLRFLVPHDLRYSHCDCAETAPCVHVPLAVWAFQRLAPGAAHGLVSTRTEPLPVPVALLDCVEGVLRELATIGVAGAARPFLDKLSRLERECRAQELVWPAEIVGELARQIELHGAHNARFEPVRVAQLVGELLVRCDAIRSQTRDVPDVFVRGARSDKATEVGAARLVGIGTWARIGRGGVELSAFLQDTDSGAVVFVARDFPDPRSDDATTFLRNGSVPVPPQPLWKLAASPVIKGVGLGALGGGQVLARGGKRAPSGEFSFGRTPLSFNHQSFEWEKLRAPLLRDGFDEIEAHLSQSPPRSLRPRRAGEDVFVVPIAGIEEGRFFGAHQEVRAVLRDGSGGGATLIHPYVARGEDGVDALLTCVQAGQEVRFVAGRFGMTGAGLIVSPLALIIERGAVRSMIQPWVNGRMEARGISNRETSAVEQEVDPVRDFKMQLMEELGELLLIGLGRADECLARGWEHLKNHGDSVGFSRLMSPIDVVAQELGRKTKMRHWDSQPATTALLEAIVVAQLCVETI